MTSPESQGQPPESKEIDYRRLHQDPMAGHQLLIDESNIDRLLELRYQEPQEGEQ